ncbi:hypothetical protein Sj15T_10450 [Sphingobium sp. TA15]|nr:hypothetical protein Sj15T_10450 [Sphingobium sp. TA15]
MGPDAVDIDDVSAGEQPVAQPFNQRRPVQFENGEEEAVRTSLGSSLDDLPRKVSLEGCSSQGSIDAARAPHPAWYGKAKFYQRLRQKRRHHENRPSACKPFPMIVRLGEAGELSQFARQQRGIRVKPGMG